MFHWRDVLDVGDILCLASERTSFQAGDRRLHLNARELTLTALINQ